MGLPNPGLRFLVRLDELLIWCGHRFQEFRIGIVEILVQSRSRRTRFLVFIPFRIHLILQLFSSRNRATQKIAERCPG